MIAAIKDKIIWGWQKLIGYSLEENIIYTSTFDWKIKEKMISFGAECCFNEWQRTDYFCSCRKYSELKELQRFLKRFYGNEKSTLVRTFKNRNWQSEARTISSRLVVCLNTYSRMAQKRYATGIDDQDRWGTDFELFHEVNRCETLFALHLFFSWRITSSNDKLLKKFLKK